MLQSVSNGVARLLRSKQPSKPLVSASVDRELIITKLDRNSRNWRTWRHCRPSPCAALRLFSPKGASTCENSPPPPTLFCVDACGRPAD